MEHSELACIIAGLKKILEYVKYHEDADSLRKAIEILENM